MRRGLRGAGARVRQYLVFLPLSIIMDIVRLVSYHAHGFIIFICVLQFLFKFVGLWYAYRLCKRKSGAKGNMAITEECFQDSGTPWTPHANTGLAHRAIMCVCNVHACVQSSVMK